MPRETTTITTPNGHTIEAKAYLTGRESRELQKAIYEDAELRGGQGGKMEATMRASAIFRAQEATIRLLVIAVDGNKENPGEAVDNLRAEDYNSIIAALDKIAAPAIEGNTDFLAQPSTPANV